MTPRVGDTVPELTRTITLTDMVAYAGATWDWHQMHYDPAFLARKGLPAAVVDGQVFGALLVEQLQDWLGPQCFVRKLHFTFKALVFAGETIRCEGTVTEADDTQVVVTQRIVVVGADGQETRVAVAKAGATVLLGRADGPGAA
ncbi:MaoC/PaaZ C-terminal domain-containing protein [Melissospora conviva]|uniref:MaoC/PaaZ C-terminal domain-containing protein n=1 Tax=Melissospora conviva TaxID=3388432 RepID=UPI003C2864F0